MDYEDFAKEYIELMFQMRKNHAHKKINDSFHGENVILMLISESDFKISPGMLTDYMGISSARVAAALKSLESKQLVVRENDKDDRRKVWLSLTEKGKNQIEEKKKRFVAMTKEMLEYLGENDSKELLNIMKKLSKWKCLSDN